MRIIGGQSRGRTLRAPAGQVTRPTSQRARQIIFDLLMHAPWYGRTLLENALVLDCFAGTGALGLEALSRGAKFASFFEKDRSAATILRDNIKACSAEIQSKVFLCDATKPPTAPQQHNLVFLDPPYGKGLISLTLRALRETGWLAEKTLIIAESEHQDDEPGPSLLLKRHIGVAELRFWYL
ncbi:16S rRNA (guanine(966)-N(2))-methyltransferase RsmD [Acetobacteraceae bacterium ESL0709]|nr:16S rRNA (guanine(966)-N(2))-methyltransferase RsmD [Acetobacteraceae bacterium ESL0697]MDF7678775.1 16S rRNA (guanine(966)-N(2))-methyltransferase RsmD [Acetobacteraceae bacterium ESL0709]